MHNLIMEKVNPKNVIDHIDHNPLNNRKSNLREVSPQENSTNIAINKSKTGVRNVTVDHGKYRVRINKKSFGCYDTLEEAIEVADRERSKIFPLSNTESNRIEL